MTLPFTIAYTIGAWLLCGLVARQFWLQFGCFAITSYLMLVLNNQNALIRLYSRMVSSTFLVLSCAACFLMSDIRGNIMQMFVVAAYLFLFQTYQNREAAGLTYYSFLMLGLASVASPHIIYCIPMLWLMMATNLLSMSWRTWVASLLGMLTPYWFASVWLVYQGDFSPLLLHFSALIDFQFPIRYASLGTSVLLVWGLLAICSVIGIVHYLRKSSYDSIRVRLLYGIFIWMDLFAFAMMFFQPQYYDILLRIIIISTSPLVAHFLTLTSTKSTNVTFFVLTALTLSITVYNIWNTLFPS